MLVLFVKCWLLFWISAQFLVKLEFTVWIILFLGSLLLCVFLISFGTLFFFFSSLSFSCSKVLPGSFGISMLSRSPRIFGRFTNFLSLKSSMYSMSKSDSLFIRIFVEIFLKRFICTTVRFALFLCHYLYLLASLVDIFWVCLFARKLRISCIN